MKKKKVCNSVNNAIPFSDIIVYWLLEMFVVEMRRKKNKDEDGRGGGIMHYGKRIICSHFYVDGVTRIRIEISSIQSMALQDNRTLNFICISNDRSFWNERNENLSMHQIRKPCWE